MWEGTARKTGGAKALLFKELNARLAIGSQTCLCPSPSGKYKALQPDISPFPAVSSLFLRACLIPKVLLRKELCALHPLGAKLMLFPSKGLHPLKKFLG